MEMGPRYFEHCADSRLSEPESCDDGDEVNGDGCNQNCDIELGWICQYRAINLVELCGDGRRGAEQCDDGNTNGEMVARLTVLWKTFGNVFDEPSSCKVCDGRFWTEACDDGNLNNNDGLGKLRN